MWRCGLNFAQFLPSTHTTQYVRSTTYALVIITEYGVVLQKCVAQYSLNLASSIELDSRRQALKEPKSAPKV